MLIICTQDDNIRNYPGQRGSGAATWGGCLLCTKGNKDVATREIISWLKMAGDDEPICFSAHGGREALGDLRGGASWAWTFDELAKMFSDSGRKHSGPILLSICAPETEEIESPSAKLALALGKQRACQKTWVYGTIWSMSVEQPFPEPSKLGKQVDLSGAQVS